MEALKRAAQRVSDAQEAHEAARAAFKRAQQEEADARRELNDAHQELRKLLSGNP